MLILRTICRLDDDIDGFCEHSQPPQVSVSAFTTRIPHTHKPPVSREPWHAPGLHGADAGRDLHGSGHWIRWHLRRAGGRLQVEIQQAASGVARPLDAEMKGQIRWSVETTAVMEESKVF